MDVICQSHTHQFLSFCGNELERILAGRNHRCKDMTGSDSDHASGGKDDERCRSHCPPSIIKIEKTSAPSNSVLNRLQQRRGRCFLLNGTLDGPLQTSPSVQDLRAVRADGEMPENFMIGLYEQLVIQIGIEITSNLLAGLLVEINHVHDFRTSCAASGTPCAFA